jgi:hypothetical protein
MTKTQIISLKVILLFTVAIFSTFIGDYLHSFFGDWYCEGTKLGRLVPATDSNYSYYEKIGCMYQDTAHSSTWHFGYRHWLYFTMSATLFIIQLVDIINYSEKNESQN